MNTDKYKKDLESEKILLEKELGKVATANKHAQGGFSAKEDDFSSEPASLDPVEIGTELSSLSRNEAISSNLEERYGYVVKALDRIADQSYGTCTICGGTIDTDRLDANPAADTCKEHMI